MGALDIINNNSTPATPRVADNAIPNSIARDSELPTVNNGTLTVNSGGGLTGSGTFTANQAGNGTITLSHSDTSNQGSSNNSGTTFIQDITLDAYGHVTGIGTATAGGGTGNNTSTTAVGAYAMVGATNPTNTNVGTGTSFAGNSSVYQYAGITAGVNNYRFNLMNTGEIARNGNIPAGTWHFRGAGGTNTGRCTLCQRTA